MFVIYIVCSMIVDVVVSLFGSSVFLLFFPFQPGLGKTMLTSGLELTRSHEHSVESLCAGTSIVMPFL